VTTLAHLLRAVEDAAPGPSTLALFDLDGTLVDGYTAAALYQRRLRQGDVRFDELARGVALGLDSALLGGDPARLVPFAVAALAGRSLDELEVTVREALDETLAHRVRPELRMLVDAHREHGHTTAIVSSATSLQVRPFAELLGIDEVRCSELAVEDGRLTGLLAGPMMWGAEKAGAALGLARKHGGSLADAFAYANGDEDVPLLAAVGRPRAVAPQTLMERVARREGWPVLTFEQQRRANLGDALGTAAAAVGMNAVVAAGLAVRRLPGLRRSATNLTSSLAFQAALTLAGVRLRVSGAGRLRAPRPAVYVFNHRSNLDPLVCSALLGDGFTATGKVEARRDPVGALAGSLLEAVYLDRSDPAAAYAALEGLAERVRSGTSALIAPEGTRVTDAEPGPYKKGAFELARSTRAPIVPIVLRGTDLLMPPGAKAIRSGTVDVAVLEPLASDDWTPSDLEGVAEDVRRRTIATLENWPRQ
jgi:putative phosphoserine phosphatase/1-acylglycerol-3-phosphate O-acyltransferase